MTDRVESPSEPVVVGPSFGLHSGALAQEMRVGLRGRRSWTLADVSDQDPLYPCRGL